MDSKENGQQPCPKRLKTFCSGVASSEGNTLLHQFVLDNPIWTDPNDSNSESYINDVLMSMNGRVDVNALNDKGHSALHLAVVLNNAFMVRKLLSCLANIDVNANCEAGAQYTALHFAAKLGNLSIVEELLNKGADVEGTEWSVETVLICAVFMGHLDVVELLVSKGANVNAMGSLCRKTPLYYAACSGKIEVVKCLLNNGASLSVGMSPQVLHAAVESGNIAMVEYLISIGADLNAGGIHGWTPLCYAAKYQDLDFIKQLLDINEHFKIEIVSNPNVIIAATSGNKIKTIKYLIEKGIDVNGADRDGRTPLHWACIESKLEVVDLLLKSGCDVDAEDNRGNIPLHCAIDINRLECIPIFKANRKK